MQHDYVLDNQNGAAFRADLNNALQSGATNNAGASAPVVTYPLMWWADTTNNLLKIRNAADSAWVTVGDYTVDNLGAQPYDADTAKTDVVQDDWAVQRTQETPITNSVCNLNAALDFKCTPTGSTTLTFTNIPATPTVQKGSIVWVNGSAYAVAAHANTKISSTLLATLSATGTYLVSYRTSNGVVYVSATGALA